MGQRLLEDRRPISIHILTWRMTDILQPRWHEADNFNPHPHMEDDATHTVTITVKYNFNPHPHMEDDESLWTNI